MVWFDIKIFHGLKMKRDLYRAICVIGMVISGWAYAGEDNNELAKASLNALKINHYAEHIAAPFQEYVNFDYGQNNTQSIFYFKPVVPFHLTSNMDLIIRTIAPLYERTPTRNAQQVLDGHYVEGWGDINPTFFITPAKFKSIIVGFGPTVSIPTATNKDYIGTGKWSLGPELALYYLQKNWIVGCLTNNLWSVAGDAQKPAVSTFQFEYLISYVFDQGWYIDTNPTITANWKSAANQQWTVPFGIGAGRIVKYGQQNINLGVTGNYNVIRPTGLGPTWQLQFQVEWLFNPP